MDFAQSDLMSMLQLKSPLIQAPLGGGPGTPELSAAVCNAGGFGILGGAYLAPDELNQAIQTLTRATDRPFGVNLFIPAPIPSVSDAQKTAALAVTRTYRHELGLPDPVIGPPFAPDFSGQIEVVLAARPAVFSFTFGVPESAILAACRARGIRTIGTATCLTEAITLQNAGVDAVVAQGVEAGGHRGMLSASQKDPLIGTFALTRTLASQLRIPVIAAGGIMDGKGIAAALVLGAQAAQLGTAFLACDEAGTAKAYREILTGPAPKITCLTRAFSGRWARGIENRFIREMRDHEELILPFPIQNQFTRDIRKKSIERDEPAFLSLWAGQGVDLIRPMKAQALVEILLRETAQTGYI